VGKTYVAAGFAVTLRKMGIDVGVMKPFAAGIAQQTGFKSEDVEILANAAHINDPEILLNPQFFPIAASPYTALKNLKIKPNIKLILNSFNKLSKLHSMMLVEGIGGIMTPILRDYFVTNLIKDMKLSAIIVTRTKVGTINHTIMTCRMCEKYKIPVKGIVINNFDTDGYHIKELKRDLENLTNIPVLGSIPFIDDMNDTSLYHIFKKNIDFKSMLS
jgi:dethiobiotin synthetase